MNLPSLSVPETNSPHCCVGLLVFTQKQIHLTRLQSSGTCLCVKLALSLLLLELLASILVGTLTRSHKSVICKSLFIFYHHVL